MNDKFYGKEGMHDHLDSKDGKGASFGYSGSSE